MWPLIGLAAEVAGAVSTGVSLYNTVSSLFGPDPVKKAKKREREDIERSENLQRIDNFKQGLSNHLRSLAAESTTYVDENRQQIHGSYRDHVEREKARYENLPNY